MTELSKLAQLCRDMLGPFDNTFQRSDMERVYRAALGPTQVAMLISVAQAAEKWRDTYRNGPPPIGQIDRDLAAAIDALRGRVGK